MLQDIKDYCPDVIDFVLSDEVKEKFAEVTTLFRGAENVDEVIEKVNEYFNAEFPTNEVARRYIDDFEVQNIREEYAHIVEDELPQVEREQLDAIDQAKRIKKEADDNLLSVRSRIKELASRVKDGKEDYKLSSKNTFRIALNGHYLTYSWVDGEIKLVKAERVPDWDKNKIWAQEDKNRKGMEELFGVKFPEVVKPKQDEAENANGESAGGDGDPDDIADDDNEEENNEE
jgi:hypothetical protein